TPSSVLVLYNTPGPSFHARSTRRASRPAPSKSKLSRSPRESPAPAPPASAASAQNSRRLQKTSLNDLLLAAGRLRYDSPPFHLGNRRSEGRNDELQVLTMKGPCAMSEPAANPIRVRKIGHVGLYCRDLDRMADFYTRVLGFQVSDTNEKGLVFLRFG